MKKILANTVYSDSTLNSWSKKDLIEHIRILEHNWESAEESLNIQAKNYDRLLKQSRIETVLNVITEIKSRAWSFNTDENDKVWEYHITVSELNDIVKQMRDN